MTQGQVTFHPSHHLKLLFYLALKRLHCMDHWAIQLQFMPALPAHPA
jgi:hypothetical protein